MGMYAGVAALVVAAISAVYQGYEQHKAGKEAEELAKRKKEIGEKNALREEAENLEQQRRMQGAAEQAESRSRAMAAASGLESTGFGDVSSIALALADQAEENKYVMDWEKRAGESRASIIRAGGELAGDIGMEEARMMKARGTGSIIEGIGKGVGAFGTGYNWWSASTTSTENAKIVKNAPS